MIRVENLHYNYTTYEGDVTKALEGVSFHIKKGEWVSIVGRNGSGKSTLAKLLDGLLESSEGWIEIGGLRMNADNLSAIRKQIGMVFQNPDNQFVGSTVQDDVAFGLENQGLPRTEMIKRVHDALERVQMKEFIDKEPARLSGGQKQRVAIAGVLAMQNDILILDEATAMLDPTGRHQIISLIKELQSQTPLTVLSITHDVQEVALSDRVLVLNSGRLVFDGAPSKLFVQPQQLESHGLELPLSEKIRQQLAQRGVVVPDTYLSQEALEEFIWQLISTK